MLYTLFILFTGIYLGQEFAIIPSVRIIVANLAVYLRGLPDPAGEQNVRNVIENVGNGWYQTFRRYFFW
jgi:hypothetical protein